LQQGRKISSLTGGFQSATGGNSHQFDSIQKIYKRLVILKPCITKFWSSGWWDIFGCYEPEKCCCDTKRLIECCFI